MKTADRAAQDAATRVVALVDELQAARANLVDLRSSAVWASLYPAPEAGQAPPVQQVHGGQARPVAQALGVAVAVQAERVFALLREDAQWLKDAMTPEQKAALLGRDPNPADAVWNDTPEGAEFERNEQQAKRDAYKALWGNEPGEYDLIRS